MKFCERHLIKRIFPLILSLCLLLTACSGAGQNSQDKNAASQNQNTAGQNRNIIDTQTSRDFADFSDRLFRESVSSDALSLNYTLAAPEKYGVSPTCDGFQPISYEALKNSAPETENLLSALAKFDRDDLSQTQQLLYDCLAYTLETEQRGAEYILFSRPLSPVTGIQAQLPVLLAEYTFDSPEDIENYFVLLESIPGYFESILTFLKLQEKNSLLPCRDTLDAISNQCLAFVEKEGSSVLTKSFRKRLNSCSFLDKAAKKEYRKKNKALIQSCIIPAYETLLNGLSAVSPGAGTNGSLCSYENGKNYYTYLFASETGSATGPEEYCQLLTERLQKSRETLLSYARKDPSLFSGLNDRPSPTHSPEEQLSALSTAIQADFPEVTDVDFTVSYVDPSLEDYLSPAFYLTPPLDAFTQNVIYINNSSRFAGSDLSTTLAHEGYPGHLYQNVCHRQQELPLLSYALNFNGYTEGWATYAELYSYKYLGYTKDEVGILRNNMIVSLCIYGICDIGIHYYGWGEDKVLEFLNENGNFPAETAHSLYRNIIDEPGSYLKYTIGYMEFDQLKKAARQQWGTNYSEKAFHQFVLSAGPAPFPVLLKYMPANPVQNVLLGRLIFQLI